MPSNGNSGCHNCFTHGWIQAVSRWTLQITNTCNWHQIADRIAKHLIRTDPMQFVQCRIQIDAAKPYWHMFVRHLQPIGANNYSPLKSLILQGLSCKMWPKTNMRPRTDMNASRINHRKKNVQSNLSKFCSGNRKAITKTKREKP